MASDSAAQAQEPAHAVVEAEIHQVEEYRREEHHHEDHEGRRDRFPARRPSDPRHLLPDLPQKLYGSGFCHDIRRKTALYSAHRGRIPETSKGWQEWRGSNPQPPVLETGALPVELHSYQRVAGEGHFPLQPSIPCDEELGSKGVRRPTSTLCDASGQSPFVLTGFPPCSVQAYLPRVSK